MNISNRLNESLALLNKFEQLVNTPKNNSKILNCISNISDDLKKYNSLEQFESAELKFNDNKLIIREIIKKIDNLTHIVLPKSQLSNNFSKNQSTK